MLKPPTKIQTEIEDTFAQITLPDRRSIIQWAQDEIDLCSPPYSVSGKLDLSLSPYLIEPLQALGDDSIRTVVICASPRLGKSLLSDVLLSHSVKRDIADVLLCFHTHDALRAYYNQRLVPFLSHNGILSDRADRFDTTKNLIRLPSSTIRLVSVNNANALTGLSARIVVVDECWRLEDGNTLAQARNRSLDYKYSSKCLFISQASLANKEFATEFRQGHQAEWGFKCPVCGKEQLYYLCYSRTDSTYGGLCWDTNETTKPNGQRDIERTLNTIRYECIHCRKAYSETDRKLLFQNGLYIPQNDSPLKDVKSYKVNCFASDCYSFRDIAKKYLTARHEKKRGKSALFINFHLQELSTFWDDSIGRETYSLKLGQTDENGKPADGAIRISTADVMQRGDLIYYTICEFNKPSKTISLIAHGKTDSFEHFHKINNENKVLSRNVLVDSGEGIMTRRIYAECAKHGLRIKGRWYCWTATKGESPKDGTYFNTTTGNNTFFSKPKSQDANVILDGMKLYCPFLTFSADTAKFILKDLLDGKHPDFKILMSKEALADESFKEQLQSEFVDYSGGKPSWKLVKEHALNHYWDCLVLQCVAGGVLGYL